MRNEVFEKLRDAMDISGRHGVIKMKLPGPIGIKMRRGQPTNPPGIVLDLPPLRNRPIERRFEIAPLRHGRGIRGRKPGHQTTYPYGALPFEIGGSEIRPSRAAATMSASCRAHAASSSAGRRPPDRVILFRRQACNRLISARV